MSKTPYIIYRPYKDLSIHERLLMSWVISLNDAKQVICFSNEYAAKMLGVSVPTITRTISNLKSLGYINTFQPNGERRIIHLVRCPELEDINLEVCDLEGVENMTTPHSQIDYPPSSQRLDPLIKLTTPLITEITNNKEYNKEYTKEGSSVVAPYPTNFLKLVELYQEDGVNMERAFMNWNRLDTTQQKMAVDNVGKYLLYLDRSKKNKKNLQFYLSDGAYAWTSVKNFRETKKDLTDKERQDLLKQKLNL